jgi:GNAT acetyltransferase-like protein
VKARLVDDAGDAASAPKHFFRSPGFLSAEGATHSLLIEAGGVGVRASLPVLVREIPGGEGREDAISPYGYPGGAIAGDPIDSGLVDWSRTGLVSAFIREAAGSPVFADSPERSELQICDFRRASGIRRRLEEQIRATERSGYKIARIHEPDATDRDAFRAVYTETMERTGAGDRYFFDGAYFEAVLGEESAELLLCHAPDGEPAAGAIAARSDGVLHYFLGGTADSHLEASPMKNLFSAMMEIAAVEKVPLNLGGGVTPGDGLERFKRGFANATMPFRTAELVLDEDAYARLSASAQADGFFPAYRAPRS